MTPMEQMKQKAKAVWSDFALMENFTGMAAPQLVKFANINANDRVLDVACGTGVVALTAARSGASSVRNKSIYSEGCPLEGTPGLPVFKMAVNKVKHRK